MVIASGQLTSADQARMVQVVAQLYFQGKDYPKAATWAARSLKESGPNADMHWLLIRAQYLADDCASASRELRRMVDAEAKSSAPPAQERLQMLATCYTKLGDDAGYAYALDKLPRLLSEQGATGRMRSVASRAGPGSRIGFVSTSCGCDVPPARSSGTPAYVGDDAARDDGGPARRKRRRSPTRGSRPARWERAPTRSSRRGCAMRRRNRWSKTKSSLSRARKPPVPRRTASRSSTSASRT